jgi:predicted metal-dependent hydrolase
VKSWLLKTYRKRPKVFERYRPVEYYTGKMINTVLETYTVHLKFVERKTIKANINGYDLSLSIPAHHSAEDKMVGKAVSKAIAKSHQQWFEKRVDFLNDKHFNEEIEAVNLRYAETRWGSCNNRNRISISTRALLAPEKILDHIIIHELAHLKELNHSSAFWGWVSKADPNFREHDKWLKDNGYQLRY